MSDNLRHKQRREQSEQMLQQYLSAYGDLLHALLDIRTALQDGGSVQDAISRVNEAIVVDDAMWHLHEVERKSLAREHAAQRKRARTRSHAAHHGGAR